MTIETAAFADLIQRVRAGDPLAAAELLQQYEPLIRREVRLRLEDPRLRTVLDTMDVCQSVMASFFLRTNLGEYQLDDPQQLIRLLTSITRNKVASAARREYRQKRDRRKLEVAEEKLRAAPANEETPSQIVADKELLDRARRLLDQDDVQIADLRRQGFSWEQIAAQFGGTAHACRVRFGRAVQRVLKQLGLAPEAPADDSGR